MEIHLHEACAVFTKKQVVKYLGSKFKLFELVIKKSKGNNKVENTLRNLGKRHENLV